MINTETENTFDKASRYEVLEFNAWFNNNQKSLRPIELAKAIQ